LFKQAIDTIKSIRVEKTSINFPGISLELGMKQKEQITPQYLRELYKIHYTLSRFYFLYQGRQMHFEEPDELILSMNDEAIVTYRKLSDDLLDSEYFLILTSEERTKIRESFDYVNMWDTYLDASDQNYVEADDIEPYVLELLNLYEKITKQIEDIEIELGNK